MMLETKPTWAVVREYKAESQIIWHAETMPAHSSEEDLIIAYFEKAADIMDEAIKEVRAKHKDLLSK